MKQKNVKSALYMPHYGISTIVMTNQKTVESYLDGYRDDGLHLWPQMRKQFTFNEVKLHLLKEDDYFSGHLNEANRDNMRWTEFCDGCVELATLDYYLFGNQIHILHPDSYGDKSMNPKEAALIGKPDLIEGVPVQRRDH
jgi:glycogen synthase